MRTVAATLVIAGMLLGLCARFAGALTITSNPSGLVGYSANPFFGMTPSATNMTGGELGGGAFDRNAGNGSRTRGTGSSVPSYFTWTTATPFAVQTVISADWSYSTWGPYVYGIKLNGVDLGISRTAGTSKGYFIQALPTVQTGITSATFNFTQLATLDNSGTVFEAWLLPEKIYLLPLTGASVSYTAPGGTWGNTGGLFDNTLDDPVVFLLNGAATSMTIDLGGTQPVKALMIKNDWRDDAGMISYFDGTWHQLFGFSDSGYGMDVFMLSQATRMSKIKVDFTATRSDLWSGFSEFQVFTGIIPEPASLALFALGGLVFLRRPRR